MRFSDIHTIIIGERGEYGKRLVRYLESHLSATIRVYHFTTVEAFLLFKESADMYLLEKSFFSELSEDKQSFLGEQSKLILLTDQEEEGTFCKYHNPRELLDRLEELSGAAQSFSETEEDGRQEVTKLTIVYSPVYDGELKEIAQSLMRAGDVYIGAEDLGYGEKFTEHGVNGDMGDLCYYIHLREENILNRLQEMLITEGEVEVLYPPDMYFYLRELTREDYLWFFDKVRRESRYREVFWGAENGFVADLELLRCFDRIILVDSRENVRQNLFCNRLEKILNIRVSGEEVWKRIYREDILNGAAR